ncbi:hypothetical protein [Paraburkholderia sp. BCC1884]|uniref:hypothetical protein n=1 Tax=Paraburkholderia sp. BCC1884 TaxID=2562668 RepID=UPI001183515C|nr:hypothetical protein [Paraburkholderia sp. BCC1884]
MDILDVARKAGMVVVLEGKIGREEYQSVHGSLAAFQRFVDSVLLKPDSAAVAGGASELQA